MSSANSLLTLGGGCFWCLEAAFERLEGVVSALPGYMGGHEPAPTYERVCRGDTGYAEVVQIEFDPVKIDAEALLTVFFTIHDPTTLNRQGHDIGTQYRSVIFYHDPVQARVASEMIRVLGQSAFPTTPVVTEVLPAATFYLAEAEHHGYFRKNPYQGYCMAVVAPKVEKVRRGFPGLLR